MKYRIAKKVIKNLRIENPPLKHLGWTVVNAFYKLSNSDPSYVDKTCKIITEQKNLLEIKFDYLYKMWKSETCYISNPNEIFRNQYYKEIVKLGECVLPLIFDELKYEGSLLFHACEDITRIKLSNTVERGRIDLIWEAWLKWAKENDY